MINNFQNCLAITLKEEGGNDDDPNDHGGRTSRGITQREYDAYRHLKNQMPADVWLASQEQVQEIYLTQYWSPYGDSLPLGIDLCFFDFCVNAGRQQAVKCLQRAVGVTADGMFGLRTKTAIDQCTDIGGLIHDYCDQRRSFYRALRQFSRYGNGWLARANRIEKAAATMANTVTALAPFGKSSASPKANPEDIAKTRISPEAGAAAATSSSVGAGIMDQIQQATSQLAQFQDTIVIVKYILIGVALVGFGFTVYGIIHRRKIKEATG